VAAQTYRDILVVVADNSGLAAGHAEVDAILAEFPALDFFLIRHPTSIDVAANFNSLVDAAQGEFWVCLPDDDRLCPDFVSRSVEALDGYPGCGFAFTDHWIIRADGRIDEPESIANSIHYGRTLLKEGVYRGDRLFEIAMRQSLCLQAAMFRTPTISSYRFIPGILAVDYSLFLRMGVGDVKPDAYYIDARLMEYRLHGSQISLTTGRKAVLQASIAALESVSEVPTQHAHEFERKLGSQYLALALMEAELGERKSARAHAIRSLELSRSPRNVAGAALGILVPWAIPWARSFHSRVRALRPAPNH
jgi:hypothetical protein